MDDNLVAIVGQIPVVNNLIDLDTVTRQLRDRLLRENVDIVNPIWYASLTAEQQQELAVYRQQLLDVTTQPGWPAEVVWPTVPSFV